MAHCGQLFIKIWSNLNVPKMSEKNYCSTMDQDQTKTNISIFSENLCCSSGGLHQKQVVGVKENENFRCPFKD